MLRPSLIALLSTLAAVGAGAPAGAQTSNCEPLREQIAAKFKAGGLPQVQLLVVDAGTASTGKVVGTCDRGTRKIVQVNSRSVTPPAKAAPGKNDPILTECKDGTVSMGGSCRK
jgi:Protein of unknown function (DUF1161)